MSVLLDILYRDILRSRLLSLEARFLVRRAPRSVRTILRRSLLFVLLLLLMLYDLLQESHSLVLLTLIILFLMNSNYLTPEGRTANFVKGPTQVQFFTIQGDSDRKREWLIFQWGRFRGEGPRPPQEELSSAASGDGGDGGGGGVAGAGHSADDEGDTCISALGLLTRRRREARRAGSCDYMR